jgi:hypothetical protein
LKDYNVYYMTHGGGRYVFDENETEGGSTDCRRDVIYTSNGKVNYRFEYGTAYCKQVGTLPTGFY